MSKQARAAALAIGAGLVGYAVVTGGFGTGGGQGEENAFQQTAPGRGLGRGAGASPFKQQPTAPNYNINIEASDPASPTPYPSSSGSSGGSPSTSGGAVTKKQSRTSGSAADNLTTDKDFGGGDLQKAVFNPATSRLKKEVRKKEERDSGSDLLQEGGVFDSGRFL